MFKLLVPALVIVTVALSSSNGLPILSMKELHTEPFNFDYIQNDNTYSNNHQSRNKLNGLLLNVNVEPNIEKIPQKNDQDNNESFSHIDKDYNYNVKGFRKEQWHNYPRQLDRLNRYFYKDSTDKRNLDPDDPDESERLERSLENTNELDLDNDFQTSKIKNEAEVAAAVINPLLIFRIHLACYNKDLDINPPQQTLTDFDNDQVQGTNKKESSYSNDLNPELNLIKVKREDKTDLELNERNNDSSKYRTMNKRIFSLWSRLQSLNPKGHQLHHRRHMYALYGPPDLEGGGPPPGVLTAETRATFMRPPGSPLRWG